MTNKGRDRKKWHYKLKNGQEKRNGMTTTNTFLGNIFTVQNMLHNPV